MAIGRVAGPMLLTDLDRQGLDLSFTTNSNPLAYLDFTNFTLSVRSQGGPHAFNVNGNVGLANLYVLNGNTITTQNLDQGMLFSANGAGEISIVNANVNLGKINNVSVGITTPAAGTFTYLNSTRLTAGFGRVTFTDNQGLTDNDDLRYFTGNSTLVAGNVISKSGTVGFNSVVATNLQLYSANVYSVGFFDAAQQLVTSSNLQFFTSNNTLNSANVRLPSELINKIAYVDSAYNLRTSSYLSFNGTDLSTTGVTTLGTVSIYSNRITTATGTNSDLLLVPDGSGVISVQNNYLTDVPTPVNPGDAANKQYVDAKISINATNSISQGQSSVVAEDLSGSGGPVDVVVTVAGVQTALFNSTYANLQLLTAHVTTLGTKTGRLYLQPFNNDKITTLTNSALTLPVGQSGTRPTLPDLGDIRFNSQSVNIEWYDGTKWSSPQIGNTGISTQTLNTDGVNNVFTLDRTSTTEAVLVNINGVVQQPVTSYQVSGTQITFVDLPLATDSVEVRFLNVQTAYVPTPVIVDTFYTTVGTTSNYTIDAWLATLYRSAKYTYSAKSATGPAYEIGEISLVHDGVTVYTKISFTGSAVSSSLTWSAVINPFGIMALRVTGTYSDTKIKLHKIYFTDT